MNEHILIVEDDTRYASRMRKNLSLEGYQVTCAVSGEEAWECIRQQRYDLIISDVKMPGISGMELLTKIKNPPDGSGGIDIPVILLTSVDSLDVAVSAMKLGAADYLTKDAERDEIVLRIEKVLSSAKLHNENRRLRTQLQSHESSHDFLAVDPKSQSLLQETATIAETGAGVLITGETGTGKELIARRIHQQSPRHRQAFIDVNCAALPADNLFQSEVFGHEKGAFTGAVERKLGKLELAHQGTLFLDEIGDMPLESQGKILRALETQEFERIGGTQKIRVDVNIIAATNKHLEHEVEEGRFRQDLFFRLDVIRFEIPPLRERTTDIIPLFQHFLRAYANKYRRTVPLVSHDGEEVLLQYAFPGNVRELKNLAERIVIRHKDCSCIDANLLKTEGLVSDKSQNRLLLPTSADEILPLEEMEKQYIIQALEHSNWVQSEAAKRLKISPDRMHNRVKKYGISHPSWRAKRA